MTQIPAIQSQQYPIFSQPSYNAVKIDIHNPQVNAPGCDNQGCNPAPKSAPITAPIYEMPKAPIYEVPRQSIYEPKQDKTVAQPPVVKEIPVVPAPVIVQPTAVQTPIAPIAKAPVAPIAQAPVIQAPIINPPIVQTSAPTTAKTVEVKAPEVATPKVDVNAFIAKLTSPDYEQQANAMEMIADMAQATPDKATELLDTRVIDTLLGIMNQDSSKLTGPTAQQLQIREKIMTGKPVSEVEMAEANKITPMEQAERNKQFAIYTTAILEKLYGSEIQKMNNTVVPMTELPGAAGIVEQIKNNPNPMIRAAGIDALSFIQKPEYKQDLTTLFTVAKNDKDVIVQQTAAKALEKLTKADSTQKASA